MIETNQTIYQPINYAWIENLAMEELNMDESGIVNLSGHLNPALLLEESSIDLMNEIKDRLEAYITRFNEHRGRNNSSSAIKILKFLIRSMTLCCLEIHCVSFLLAKLMMSFQLGFWLMEKIFTEHVYLFMNNLVLLIFTKYELALAHL